MLLMCGRYGMNTSQGFTMLEVLVTILILAIGLLGLAGLQTRVQVAETEAYQRAQAIVLLEDIKARINANRKHAMDYVTAAPLGTGSTVADCAGLNGAAFDTCQWGNALLGAAESLGAGKTGAMVGARGCIANTVPTMPREFLVSVVWQGLSSTVAPTSTTCGQNEYGNDAMRRAIVARIVIGCLQNDTSTGLCVTP